VVESEVGVTVSGVTSETACQYFYELASAVAKVSASPVTHSAAKVCLQGNSDS
jgi:hypothetical protein